MISTTSVTFLCIVIRSSGKSSHVVSTKWDGVFPVGFPFREPRLGPRMSSAWNLSVFVIGQFGNILLSTYLI